MSITRSFDEKTMLQEARASAHWLIQVMMPPEADLSGVSSREKMQRPVDIGRVTIMPYLKFKINILLNTVDIKRQ